MKDQVQKEYEDREQWHLYSNIYTLSKLHVFAIIIPFINNKLTKARIVVL